MKTALPQPILRFHKFDWQEEILYSMCCDIQSPGDCELPTGQDEDVYALQTHDLRPSSGEFAEMFQSIQTSQDVWYSNLPY